MRPIHHRSHSQVPSFTPPLFHPIFSSSSWSSTTRNLWTTLLSSQGSPAAFASLFLGISLALMLFGSLAFVVGFMLLPWVTTLALAFNTAMVVSIISRSGLTILGSTPILKDLHGHLLTRSAFSLVIHFCSLGFIEKLRKMSC